MANKFISGTLILTLSGFVVKAIGSINWIILSRILGGEGIGIYQMAFPIYLLALDISSAGLPIAISIITAEKVAKQDYFGAQRIFHVSLSMLCTTALFLSILMFFGSSFLIDEHIIRESRAYYSLIALAPAIFFTTIIAGYRGYLQGWQQMTPTAISQIVEQLVRVVVMLGFAALLLPYGLDYAAVRGASAQAQSVLAEHLAVVVIELVAVTVALGDILLTVAALHGAALEDVAGIRAETQASALVYIIMLIGQKINDFM